MNMFRKEYAFYNYHGRYYLIVYNYRTDSCKELQYNNLAGLYFNHNIVNNGVYSLIDFRHILISEYNLKESNLFYLEIDVEKNLISKNNFNIISKVINNKELEKIKVFS